MIDGMIEGNVRAAQRLQLNSKARLKGDIVAERLSTEEGASIVGHVTVGPDAIKAAGGAGSGSDAPKASSPPSPPAPPHRK